MTLCLSTMSLHLGHWQSLQLQKRLCPFRGDTKPWFLQREHLGILGGFRPLGVHTLLLDSGTCLLGFSLLMADGCTRTRRTQSELWVYPSWLGRLKSVPVPGWGAIRSPSFPALLLGWERLEAGEKTGSAVASVCNSLRVSHFNYQPEITIRGSV